MSPSLELQTRDVQQTTKSDEDRSPVTVLHREFSPSKTDAAESATPGSVVRLNRSIASHTRSGFDGPVTPLRPIAKPRHEDVVTPGPSVKLTKFSKEEDKEATNKKHLDAPKSDSDVVSRQAPAPKPVLTLFPPSHVSLGLQRPPAVTRMFPPKFSALSHDNDKQKTDESYQNGSSKGPNSVIDGVNILTGTEAARNNTTSKLVFSKPPLAANSGIQQAAKTGNTLSFCRDSVQESGKKRKNPFEDNDLTLALSDPYKEKELRKENPACLPKKQRIVPPKGGIEDIHDNIDLMKKLSGSSSSALHPSFNDIKSLSLGAEQRKMFPTSDMAKVSSLPKQSSQGPVAASQSQPKERKTVTFAAHAPLSTPISTLASCNPSFMRPRIPQDGSKEASCCVRQTPQKPPPTPRELEWGKYLGLSNVSDVPREKEQKPEEIFPYQERFKKLQAFLKRCDEATDQYINSLRSFSSSSRSGLAVQLEKRAMVLTLEEANELNRMKKLNVFQKASVGAASPSCAAVPVSTNRWVAGSLDQILLFRASPTHLKKQAACSNLVSMLI